MKVNNSYLFLYFLLFILFTLNHFNVTPASLSLLQQDAQKIILAGWILFSLPIIVTVKKRLGKRLARRRKMNRLARSNIQDIDTMDGKTFEEYLAAIFHKKGYWVKETRYVGDYGADLIVKINSVSTVIQAKRYRSKVGIRAIQEAVAAKGHYKCDKAMVVTNSFYTKPAIELARSNNVVLWDRNDLTQALLSVKNNKIAGRV